MRYVTLRYVTLPSPYLIPCHLTSPHSLPRDAADCADPIAPRFLECQGPGAAFRSLRGAIGSAQFAASLETCWAPLFRRLRASVADEKVRVFATLGDGMKEEFRAGAEQQVWPAAFSRHRRKYCTTGAVRVDVPAGREITQDYNTYAEADAEAQRGTAELFASWCKGKA